MFVIAQAQVQRLQVAEPTGGRLGRRGHADDRQSVDKQPQLLLDPRQRRRTPGDGGTERHAILAGVALQQQAPGALQQGVEGDFLAAGKFAEGLGEVTIEHDVMLGHPRTVSRYAQCLRQ